MRILILTQYFPPETGAPQNRLFGIAKQLLKEGVQVEILTAMPNYPAMEIHVSYKGKIFMKESMNSIPVFRSWIFVIRNRTIIARLLNYFSFVFSSVICSFRLSGKFDYVLCESPPLFLGISGWLISKFKRAKFIFNVSDLWPESAERLGLVSNKILLSVSRWLEEFLYRKSFLITGQTQGIVKNISARFPDKKIHWLPNGIDEEYFQNQSMKSVRTALGFSGDDFLLVYAGIIGHAQGLNVILRAALRLSEHKNIKFLIIGDGPEKENLVREKVASKLDAVFFYPPMIKDEVINLICNCDASIIPLKKLDLFKGAIPSKIFESLMMEKPLLLGVEGEAKELFIDDAEAGIYFEPENDEQLAESILILAGSSQQCIQSGQNGKKYVLKNFTRKKIVESFLHVLNN